MTPAPLIVGLGGTSRPGSTSERALQTALAHVASLGCDTLAFTGSRLPAEIYDPSLTQRSDVALALVDALRRADGLIVATPAYHGGVSGLVKNALDFAEDLRSDERIYLEGRAVGCIVCADGAQAMGSTLAALRAIVHALRGWPTPYGATLSSSHQPFGSDGLAATDATLQACAMVAKDVVSFATMRRALRG